MRKTNQEITNKAIIEELISSAKVCRLGMLDNGLPYVLPFNYGYTENTIYIHCAHEGKKIDLLKENPHVCFEIEQQADIVKNEKACKWATTYRSVVGYCNVEIITDYTAKQKALEIIMTHNGASKDVTFEPKQVDAVLILKLNITSLTAKQSSNWDKIFNASKYEFQSERLTFKEITWDDLEDIHQLHCIPEVDKYNTLGIPASISETIAVMRGAIEDKQNAVRKTIAWTIKEKDSNSFMGIAGFSLSADRFRIGEIYYELNPGFWNKGYGTEIAKRLVTYGFEDLGLHKVEAGVATENVKSIHILEKIGMTREGLRRKVLPIRGEWKDNYHYAIVEDDQRGY